jgi:hypothetical protein
VETYVRICVFEAFLRAILVDFPDTKYQELPGACEKLLKEMNPSCINTCQMNEQST